MKNIIIYCEGVAGSHDYDILSKIKADLNIKPVIVPLGGKKGAGGFINIHSKQTQIVDFYLFFRDYDFDFEDKRILTHTNLPTLLIQDKLDSNKKVIGKWCISYRTTIENYLFHPKTFFDFLEKRNECEKYNLKNETAVKHFFDTTAKELSAYQAVRHTMGKMRISTDFGTTFTSGSGKLPAILEMDSCKKLALERIANETKKANGNWTNEIFEHTFNEFYSAFTNTDFYENMDYLIWYQGKDFAKRITQKLPQFPIEKYYDYAKKHFDYTQFPDLVALRELIISRSNE